MAEVFVLRPLSASKSYFYGLESNVMDDIIA